jgi:uncharacterized membrane protein HdeD (DUF308 family)
MYIGLGIVLIIVGAALIWAVNPNLAFIDDNALGWILLIGGVLAIVLSFAMNAQRNRSASVAEDQRYNRY